ncbi:MAG: alanine:cation symporter family protein [Rhodospirillales bacterium]|nr:alanine:cation symporter family protein [Rhodospirillales bacterium]MCB9995777.1 alanine:cation symporter family protein [Rhodospirillales bacterium]
MNIDSGINEAFSKLADVAETIVFYTINTGIENAAGDPIKIPLILLWLAAASLFFTFYFGFINIRCFKHSVEVALNKHPEPDADGQISSFQALTTSLSGTVGLGNIAGVAVAITVGGPGAALWMAIMGLFSMSTKFIEVTLGVKYRHHHDPAHPKEISGGPMYYMRDGLANRNIPYLGPILAALFAVACIGGSIGGGNMFQANQAFSQVMAVTGGETGLLAGKGWLFGLVMAGLVGVVIIGGIKSIASAASKIVPLMAGLYLLAGIVIIGMNIANLPHALGVIVSEAFSFQAGLGGFIGALLAGVQRATFSNEAGLGSSAIIHAAAQTNIPAKQGIAGMMGSFVDTVIICMMTALIIVISGAYETADGVSGVELTSAAMADAVSWFPYLLTFCVVLFAYSTLITWYYYGEKALTFLVGEKDIIILAFKLIFCLFVVIGAAAQLENVIRFSDAMILSLGIPNIIGLYLMAPEVKRDLKNYLQTLKENKESKG